MNFSNEKLKAYWGEVERQFGESMVSEDKEKRGWLEIDGEMWRVKHKLPVKENQMVLSLDEIAKKITPEGMYVYLEREEDTPNLKFHVYTGEKWRIGRINYEKLIVGGAFGEIQTRIRDSADFDSSLGDEELPRRCAAQREVLKGVLDNLTGPDKHLEEYSKRMGANPEAHMWEINPPGQIKSVQVLQDMVNEEIGKLKTPEVSRRPAKVGDFSEAYPSGLTIGMEYLSGVNSVARGQPEADQSKKCECGSGKLGITHSLWCPAK